VGKDKYSEIYYFEIIFEILFYKVIIQLVIFQITFIDQKRKYEGEFCICNVFIGNYLS